MKHAQKSTRAKPAKAIAKESCPECGYSETHLFDKKCPMCKPCPRCGRKLMRCTCIEGE